MSGVLLKSPAAMTVPDSTRARPSSLDFVATIAFRQLSNDAIGEVTCTLATTTSVGTPGRSRRAATMLEFQYLVGDTGVSGCRLQIPLPPAFAAGNRIEYGNVSWMPASWKPRTASAVSSVTVTTSALLRARSTNSAGSARP